MADLAAIPNRWKRKKRECNVIIETPKSSRNKFDYDRENRLFKLAGLLPEGLAFPFDFGFIPSTLADDGDPLDVLLMMDAPAHVGCLVDARIVGVIEAEQTQEGETTRNDRLIAVALHSYEHEHVSSLSQVQKSILDQVEDFFVSYNKSRGKRFKIKARRGPNRAAELVERGIAEFQKKKK